MDDNDIAGLRADSLDGLLIAARRRRLHRRATAVFGGVIGLAILGLVLGPDRHPEQRSARMTIAPVPQALPKKPSYIVRTTTGSLSRISTPANAAVIRLTTPRTTEVRRIDTPTLADFFPDNGIAVIHGDSEPARAIFF